MPQGWGGPNAVRVYLLTEFRIVSGRAVVVVVRLEMGW